MRLIDADALKVTVANTMAKTIIYSINEGVDVLKMIDATPAIEVEPVRHGEWLNVDVNWQRGYSIAECSECGEKSMAYEAINAIKFCPNCGAKMYGG